MAVFGHQGFEHNGSMIDHIRVIHGFHGEADFAFFKAVEDVGGGYRFRALIFNVANDRAFSHNESDHGTAAFPFFAVEPDIVKPVHVPERHEVAPQVVFVIDVAHFAEDDGSKSILRDAARAAELDGFDDVFGDGRQSRCCSVGLFGRFELGRGDDTRFRGIGLRNCFEGIIGTLRRSRRLRNREAAQTQTKLRTDQARGPE